MRPSLLDPFFSSISSIPGVGPKLTVLLSKLVTSEKSEETCVIDLLFHLPSSVIDRTCHFKISQIPIGKLVTVKGLVIHHHVPIVRKNVPYKILIADETGKITLMFFRGEFQWLKKLFPNGNEVTVTGKIKKINGKLLMIHPQCSVCHTQDANFPLLEPVYLLTAGLSGKVFQKVIATLLSQLSSLPEWLDAIFLQKQNFPSFIDAFKRLHQPRDKADLDLQSPARRRLAYDELLANQIALLLVRQKFKKQVGIPVRVKGDLIHKILKKLPFVPTKSQINAIEDILNDMSNNERMLRMLQGDVGSGKTLVALIAMAAAIEAGGQAVIMVPISVLAQQHYDFIRKSIQDDTIGIEILTGNMNKTKRFEALERIASGKSQIIIGTHALFQDSIQYHNLILVVIDEQQRFGVHQRLKLVDKGISPHILMMTATPIPRTLVLIAFGDMDVSKITEKPVGRKPITTVTIPITKIDKVIDRLNSVLSEGKKAYWICPKIEENDQSFLGSAIQRFEQLSNFLRKKVGLIHGRMSESDKEAVMAAFKKGDISVLVATTVIEVGVDVSDASIMVIEHAENFGLAQLHQLRGRIGRSEEPSTCILLYCIPLTKHAYSRLSILRKTEDGFRIAEEDLKQRGEGEILGIKQSGVPKFLIANLEIHQDLLEIARKDAYALIKMDPKLKTTRGKAICNLLYLYRYNDIENSFITS
ncbi:ATP-dependent DNA helicase RecG [Liberibacter crescens]|uniref:ATP-dependent DNA helicase RecG n=1 Tax=Liberibacter crescens TaxID=1273132 RepID=UPI00076310F7|nr:ATP-dependent DNA helicase RecG [Liberibacter crescens]AMC12776.1 ATP-dependent DNA helicase RecG [Liberibacter crescens]